MDRPLLPDDFWTEIVPLDAEVIALFAERIRPPIRPLPEPERSHFAELVSRRRQILGMINMETNRRDQAADKQLIRRLSGHIAFW